MDWYLRKFAHLFKLVLRPELSATTGDDIVNWCEVIEISCHRPKLIVE